MEMIVREEAAEEIKFVPWLSNYRSNFVADLFWPLLAFHSVQ